jgi:hypothetical protein
MRFKVVLYTLFVPLVWLTLIVIKYRVPTLLVTQYFPSGILIGLFTGTLLGRLLLGYHKKYLTGLTIDNNEIKLTYLTSFGLQRQTKILLDTLTDIKIKKRDFLNRDFDLVKFSQGDNERAFSICSRSISQKIHQLIQSLSANQLLKQIRQK